MLEYEPADRNEHPIVRCESVECSDPCSGDSDTQQDDGQQTARRTQTHVLSHSITLGHALAHPSMFGVGWQQRDYREIADNYIQIAAAAVT